MDNIAHTADMCVRDVLIKEGNYQTTMDNIAHTADMAVCGMC